MMMMMTMTTTTTIFSRSVKPGEHDFTVTRSTQEAALGEQDPLTRAHIQEDGRKGRDPI